MFDKMKRLTRVTAVLGGLAVASAAQGQSVKIDQISNGFDVPWSLSFVDPSSVLVTERDGRLWHVSQDGTRQQVKGLPEITAIGQGGLLDIRVAPGNTPQKTVFFSYVKPVPGGYGLALARATLPASRDRLVDVTPLFEVADGNDTGRHFGGRIAFGPNNTLFLSVGDMGDRPSAQDLSRHWGKILRLTRDGGIPAGNPFATTENAQPEVWSLGHRNPQGLTRRADGTIWTSEHGARGGDEVNLIRKGANYGWPVISYGRHYSGAKIGEGTSKPGLEQPVFYWDPSIAPSGVLTYTGAMFPDWQGDLLIGSLKFDQIDRIDLAEGRANLVETLKTRETDRVRDLRQAPDGAIWFLSEGNGAIYRLSRR